MAISPLPQAPYRQDRKLFPTPVVGDVLFSQVKDCTRIEIPEYGTPHPDTKKWPDHKLVFVKPVDIERDGIFEFFYAADRDNQDQYNFTYSQGELVLTRTYIVSRGSLEDFVEPKLGQDDPAFPEYKFATQQVQRVEDKELDSLYVAVQRFYAKHNTTFAVDTETKTGYKIRRVSTLNKELSESGNSSSSFDEKGWTNRQETVQITGGTTLTTIDQKPFVKVQSDTTISGTPVVPETGTGSSRLIYDNGETKVYENVNDTSTPKTGPAGVEKESRPYVLLTTDKSFSTTSDITGPTGSSQVVFNDGETTVYEVNNISAIARPQKVGDEKEERPYASLNTSKRYSTNGDVATKTGSSNIVWTDGTTTIYEVNEITASPKAASVGEEKEERPYARLTTAKRYATSGTVNTGTGSSNVVWTDGNLTIYEVNEITATAKAASVGEEKEERPYARLTTAKRYATSSTVNTNTGSSNVIWTDGITTIYEVSEITANPKATSVGQEKEERPYARLTTEKRYATSGTVTTGTGSSNVVWTDGATTIYEVNEITANAKAATVGEEKEERPYASLRTAKRYSTSSSVGTKTGSSNVVWTDGVTTIYEISEITAVAKFSQAGEEKEERPYATLTTRKKYSSSPTVGSKTGSSNAVWTDGSLTIYEVNEITASAKSSNVGEEKEVRPYVTLTTKKRYSTSGNISTKTGSSNVVWTDGTTTIYEVNEITPQVQTGDPGFELRTEPWGGYRLNKKYVTAPNTAQSKVGGATLIYTDGNVKVYEETTTEIVKLNSEKYTSAKSLRDGPYIEETQTSYVQASSGASISSGNDYYTVTEVFNDGDQKVFKLDELKLTNNPLEWDEIINYEWPTVLTDIDLKGWKSRATGEYVYYPRYYFKQGFSGPQKATKKRYWQKAKPIVVAPPKLIPEGVSFRSPLFTVEVPPCLHAEFTLNSNNSTTDPEWEYTLDSKTFKATTPPDWPAEIKWVESEPHKGGYIVTETTIKKPEIK